MDKGKSEATVLKECLFCLQQKNIFCWRQNTGAFRTEGGSFFRSSMAGVADILGVLPDGRFLAVECKREKGGVLSEYQKEFLFNVSKNFGCALVVHSGAELAERLEKIL